MIYGYGDVTQTRSLCYIADLVETKSDIVFHSLPEGDPKRRCPDISKAKRLLDWYPEVPLNEGLAKTLKYFERVLNMSKRE